MSEYRDVFFSKGSVRRAPEVEDREDREDKEEVSEEQESVEATEEAEARVMRGEPGGDGGGEGGGVGGAGGSVGRLSRGVDTEAAAEERPKERRGGGRETEPESRGSESSMVAVTRCCSLDSDVLALIEVQHPSFDAHV